jgi:fatty acid desaturase
LGSTIHKQKPNQLWAAGQVAWVFVPVLLTIAAAPWAYREVGLPILGALYLFWGVWLNQFVFIMHDCAHGSLFRSRSLNQFFGHLSGLFVVTYFPSFQAQHMAHHQKLGAPGSDPQGVDYLGFKHASKGRLLWHLLKPLTGANFFKIIALVNRGGGAGSAKRKRPELGYLVRLGLLHGGITLWLAQGIQSIELAAVFYLSGLTLALFLAQLRGFAEHVAFQSDKDEFATRTHAFNPIDRVFFYGVNFNYHVEHHLKPSLPASELRKYYRQRLENGETDRAPWSIFGTVLRKVLES